MDEENYLRKLTAMNFEILSTLVALLDELVQAGSLDGRQLLVKLEDMHAKSRTDSETEEERKMAASVFEMVRNALEPSHGQGDRLQFASAAIAWRRRAA